MGDLLRIFLQVSDWAYNNSLGILWKRSILTVITVRGDLLLSRYYVDIGIESDVIESQRV